MDHTKATLCKCAIAIALVSASVPCLSSAAADPKSPPKPIIRQLKGQVPLPAYRGSPAARTGVSTEAAGSAPVRTDYRRTPYGALPDPESSTAPRSTYRLKVPLEGGVVMNVPKTPEDVAAYLQHMRSVIHDYERVAVDTLLGGGSININPATIEASRGHSLGVIQRIRATTPPAELTVAHNQLADTMGAVGDFLERPGGAAGGGLTALTQLQPLLSRLHGSLDRYHAGVKNCIAFYGLSEDLDPFKGEDEDAKQRLSGALSGMKNSLINPPAPSTPSPNSSPPTPMGVFGGSPMGALGGIDLNALQGLFGGADVGSLLGGAGAGGAGQSAPGRGASGQDFSKLGNLDANSLGNLSGNELDALKQLMGPAAAGESGSPGLQLNGQSADTLMNALKQLQGQ